MLNDLKLNDVDRLGALLAEIADLQKQADAIKDAIKDAASAGGPKVIEGSLFKASYVETNRRTFNSIDFIQAYGQDVYDRFLKTSAVFSVRVTSR